jgi:hypothetical protein
MMKAAEKLLKITFKAVREEVRETKAAKTAIKEATWNEVVGSLLYLLIPWDGASWASRRDLANVTPSAGGGPPPTYLDDQLRQMQYSNANTPERATEHIKASWPTQRDQIRLSADGFEPLKPKQLVFIYETIRRLGIVLPPREVLDELVNASLTKLPRDPRERINAPSGVYTWTRENLGQDTERWILRSGYVGQRGDKIDEVRSAEVGSGNWSQPASFIERARMRTHDDARFVFMQVRYQRQGYYSIYMGPDAEDQHIDIEPQKDGRAYIYSHSVPEGLKALGIKGGDYPSVAEAQAAVVDALVRHEATG